MADTVVCFDLGGVLVRICHTWQDACGVAGIVANSAIPTPAMLNAFEPFAGYQAGLITQSQYASAVADFLGIVPDEAIAAHDAILIEDYPGAAELVTDLHHRGVVTCCLSNTNPRHWDALRNPALHPAVAALGNHYASHEIGANKPDPATFRYVADRYPAQRFIYFDDAAANIAGARQAGWDAILVDPDDDPPRQMRDALVTRGVL